MTVRSGASQSTAGFVGAGALAGALSALVFTGIHQILINPIWVALPVMLPAGALCGLCLAWSYAVVIRTPTAWNWVQYNLLFLAMFVALGVTSLLAFDPITTITALLKTNEPPRQLIGRALPVTGGFTLVTPALLTLRYRPGWRGTGALFVTTSVLIVLLGLNISILGLVAVPRGELGVIADVFGLLVALSGVYAAAVLALGRSRFRGGLSA